MYRIDRDSCRRAWQLLAKMKYEITLSEEENTFLTWFEDNTTQYGFKGEYLKLRGIPLNDKR